MIGRPRMRLQEGVVGLVGLLTGRKGDEAEERILSARLEGIWVETGGGGRVFLYAF